jgi:Fic family protein
MNALPYAPPYTMTPEITHLVAEICEIVGRFAATANVMITPRLRRENRIRSIQGSLAIEQNSLSLDQVTAVIQGRRVLGAPREIQEVRNAFAAYEALKQLAGTDQVTDQVKSFLCILSAGDVILSEAMKKLSLVHRPTFRSNYVHPALKMGLVEMTQPEAPRSPTQRYRLTPKGRSVLEGLGK